MKKITFLCLTFCSVPTFAQGTRPMLGIIIGDPTGLSFRQSLNKEHSWDAALAYSLFWGGFHFHANYLWDKAKVFSIEKQPIEFYYGVGGRVKSWTYRNESKIVKTQRSLAIGPRFPFGLATNIETPRLQLFVEIAPVVDVLPEVDVDVNFGLGLRYRF